MLNYRIFRSIFLYSGLSLAVAAACSANTQDSPRDVTPMTIYADSYKHTSKVRFSGAYTRIVITSNLEETSDSDRQMKYVGESWLKNYVIAQQYDINLSTKVKVGEYEETIPLVTLSRTNDKNGDTWLRDLTRDRRSFPWFLVHEGADASVPRVTVEFNGSKTIGSGMAGNALQIALAGIKMVAPEASVVTTLSTNTAKDKAAAIDQILGKLFSNKLSERHTSDRDLTKWAPDVGLSVEVSIPIKDAEWSGDLKSIGGWTIGFAAPRASIFSDWSVCAEDNDETRCRRKLEDAAVKVRDQTDVGTVLSHPLIKTSAGNLSIKDYLLQQSWFSAAESSMIGDANSDPWHAEGLCKSTADAMMRLGLNVYDARLVVQSVIKGLRHNRKVSPDSFLGTSCKDYPIKLSSERLPVPLA